MLLPCRKATQPGLDTLVGASPAPLVFSEIEGFCPLAVALQRATAPRKMA